MLTRVAILLGPLIVDGLRTILGSKTGKSFTEVRSIFHIIYGLSGSLFVIVFNSPIGSHVVNDHPKVGYDGLAVFI